MLLRHAAAMEGMDPGMVVDAPAQAWSAPSDDEQQDRQRQMEQLQHVLDSIITAKGKQHSTLQRSTATFPAGPHADDPPNNQTHERMKHPTRPAEAQ